MKKEKKTNQLCIKKALVAFFICALVNNVSAQESDTTDLKEVVVSATRYEKNPNETPRSVTVITAEDLAKTMYQNLGEVLNAQEGIYVVGALQNPGANQSMFMRGMNSNQTIILIDGVRVTDPSGVNNAIDLSEISLMNIERIEIIRGSHGTMYGSAAIGGIINIITKKSGKNTINATADLSGGTFGTGTSSFTENLNLTYTHKKGIYLGAEIFNQNVKGLDAALDTITNPNIYNVRDKDNFNKTDYIFRAGYKNSKFDGFLSYRNNSQQADIDKGAFSDDGNYVLNYNRKLYSAALNYKINKQISLHYSGGYTQMERLSNNDSSQVTASGLYDQYVSRDKYTGEVMSNDLYLTTETGKIKFTLGGNYYSEKMNNKNYYYWGGYEDSTDLDTLNLGLQTVSGYFQTDINGGILSEKVSHFSLLAGTRFNSNSFFGPAFTFELNPYYKISNEKMLYFSFSTGFNTPSLYQLQVPDLFYIKGNDQLGPEKSRSFEFGYKHAIGNKISVNIAAFHNEAENVISYIYLYDKVVPVDSLQWYNQITSTYVNAGKLISNGLEINLHSKLSEKLSIAANISLVSGRIIFNPDGLDTSVTHGHHVLMENGQFLTKETEVLGLLRRPSTANLVLNWTPVKNLNLSGSVRYAGMRTDAFYDTSLGSFGGLNNLAIGDYALLDFGANYLVTKKVSVRFKAENIFNVKYSEINGYSTRGRGFYLGLRFKI